MSSSRDARDRDLLQPGVSAALARERAGLLADVRYALAFVVPPRRDEPVVGRAVITFNLAVPHRVVLDFDGAPGAVRRIRAGGAEQPLDVVDGHLVVPAAQTRAGRNEIAVEFVAADEVLNRTDRLLYTLFVPARAHRAFPCFDQPDVKGRFALTLDVPSRWMAVANTPATGQTALASGCRLQFAETAPLPTYLFAFAAGELVCTTAGGGRTFRVLHHESVAADVARNRDAIADLHAQALEWLERYTETPCPFTPLDIVLIPSFQFRGMEHPGMVLYDASRLLLPPSPTATQLIDRASLIVHETAHMWFGNLVTMRWFSDVWLKEVFANLMASSIVAGALPHINHGVRFLLSHQAEAYVVDRTAGTNAIRQPLENLRDAGELYGPIVYQKSVVMMRQLEHLVGAATFRQAVREYLRRYAYGNADWPELLALVGAAAGRDLSDWSRAWVDERGRPELRAGMQLDGEGRVAALDIEMSDPMGRDLVWPQALRIALGYPGHVHQVPVRMTDRTSRVHAAAGLERPCYVLPGGEMAYALAVLDADSCAYLLERIETISDPVVRADAWLALWENVAAGRLAAPAWLRTAVRALPDEVEEPIAERVLAWAVRAYWRLLEDDERASIGPALELMLRREIDRTGNVTWRAACFHALRDTARSADTLDWLTRIWARAATVPGLPLDEAGETALAMELAVRNAPGAEQMLHVQAARIVQPDRQAECAFLLPAVSADPRARESAFERLLRPEGRRREPWALQALRYLNHPLREVHARRFIVPSLERLPEIRRTGDIFLPARWAEAALWGHRSSEAAGLVREVLQRRADWPVRLRWIVLTAADDLFRAAGVAAERRAT